MPTTSVMALRASLHAHSVLCQPPGAAAKGCLNFNVAKPGPGLEPGKQTDHIVFLVCSCIEPLFTSYDVRQSLWSESTRPLRAPRRLQVMPGMKVRDVIG